MRFSALSAAMHWLGRVVVQHEMLHDLPSIQGDRVQLQQVLINLLMNGMDAVATRPASERCVHGASGAGGEAAFLISA